MFQNSIDDINWESKFIKGDVLLINQCDFEKDESKDGIRMISNTLRGSSNSRNMALKNATGDICIIADDDVSYLGNYEEIIQDAYERYPDADLITFQIQTPEGTPFKTGYIKNEITHTDMSILKCASIEITFKRKAIIDKGLKLDLEFGLGSKYRVHDEIIFLKDALDAGLKCIYIPVPIVVHPAESSGTDFNEALLSSKGAAFYRLFGLKGLLFDVAFSIKKYNVYKSKFSFLGCLKLMINGSLDYKMEHKK
ncbi:hypothetical protein A6E04_01705 [Aliivibrio logei]|uniref:Glycosyltransferase 2-like domain-containing protein n=2 Tax=Aliivibrio logei TaxID=688 RepID=A0A1B9NW07_ALILO|nr:hypothetical protein A6E04_01705 [Aliivibrio logei]